MEPGHILAHYEILEELGRGGMGVVYKARDTKLDRVVALKFLPAYLTHDEEATQRFVREARAASALDHANICTIHDIAETDDGAMYIVMAYYEGQPLDKLLKGEPLPVERIGDIALQLARGLERAHEAGIVHRDLKPANVMVTTRGEVKLLDFGVAKLASGTQLTKTGTQVGTVSYMSPEQLDAQAVDARSDLWSFGVVLHEMLSGQPPFEGDSHQAMMYAIVTKEPASVRDLRPDVPEHLARIVERCLQKDANDRPQSAAALVESLAGGGSAPSALLEPKATIKGKRKPAIIAVAALALAAVVAAGAVGTLASRGSSEGTAVLSDSLIAVVPFTVRGSADLDYLGEGVVDLISTKLADVGTLTAVNPRVIISLVKEEDVDVSDPAANRAVARQVHAGQYITGDLLQVGGRVTLTAYLHDTSDPDATPTQASAEGTADDLFDLIDGVVATLLGGVMADASDRMQALATATTGSLPALKAYLEGERLFRGGQYRAAGEAQDRAIALDSTFALAHYRKAVIADWTDAVYARSAAEKALQFSGNLPPRDQQLVQALTLRRNGKINEAEQIYVDHLHQHPDDVEALVQLGEVLFHDNPRRGRPLTESMGPFRRAIDLEPANLIAQIHAARVYALTDSIDALRRAAAYLAEVAPGSERALEVEAIYAYAAGDSVQQQRVIDGLAESPWIHRFYAAHGVDRFARATGSAAELLALRPGQEPLLVTIAGNLMVVQRKYDEFRELMSSLRDQRNPTWDMYEAFVLTSGAYDASDQELTAALDRVRRAQAAEILSTAMVPPYEDITARYAEFERDYLTALLLINLDRISEARRLIATLDAVPEFPGLGSTQQDAVRGLDAEILYRAGQRQEALDVLRTIEYEVPHAAAYRVVADGARSRFLRAELEREIGDPLAARNYYEGIDLSWSPWDSFYRSGAYLGLGQMAEDQGRLGAAAQYYGWLLDLWADADPGYAEEVAVIRERREALGRKIGGR